MLGFYLPNIFCLLNDKEKNSAQKFWSKDLMHEKTFRLSVLKKLIFDQTPVDCRAVHFKY